MRYELGAIPEKMTEPQMMRQVVDIAHVFGYGLVYHTEISFRSKGTSGGFPDLCLVREGYATVFLEIKGSVKSRVADNQVMWVRMLRSTGMDAYIVFPKDLDLVVRILNGEISQPEAGTGRCHPDLIPVLENELLAPLHRGDRVETHESGLVLPQTAHIG